MAIKVLSLPYEKSIPTNNRLILNFHYLNARQNAAHFTFYFIELPAKLYQWNEASSSSYISIIYYKKDQSGKQQRMNEKIKKKNVTKLIHEPTRWQYVSIIHWWFFWSSIFFLIFLRHNLLFTNEYFIRRKYYWSSCMCFVRLHIHLIMFCAY